MNHHAVVNPGTAVHDATESLMQLIHRRTSAIRIARNAAVVIWYLLESKSLRTGTRYVPSDMAPRIYT